ncbi:DegT/DnrJ/EryC1/StrS family aminotransferase [Microcoleus vaginatus]|uniref:DegT/DnrJ/EryC1/StrS family aminotransferase n=1 Tax=Microcoleus vaginatus TaxID=119532 RepID=UPI001F62553B
MPRRVDSCDRTMFLNRHQLQGSYIVVGLGFKYNMMDLQAAIGIHQMKRIPPYGQRREQIWQRYNEAFADLPITLPAKPEPDTIHAYHLYTFW